VSKRKGKNSEGFAIIPKNDYNSMLLLANLETKFYSLIAESEAFEILGSTDDKGKLLFAETIKTIKHELKQQNIKLLYKLSLDTTTIIINSDNCNKIGILSNINPHGFSC